MNYFDIIIVIPLIWGCYKGYRKGFIIEIASVVALLLAVWGGINLSKLSAVYLGSVFDISEKLMPLISFAVTFIVIVIAVFAIAKLLQKLIKMVALGFVNRLAGLIFGGLKFALILSVVLNLVNVINNQVPIVKDEMKDSSILYGPIEKLAPIIIPGIKNLEIKTPEIGLEIV